MPNLKEVYRLGSEGGLDVSSNEPDLGDKKVRMGTVQGKSGIIAQVIFPQVKNPTVLAGVTKLSKDEGDISLSAASGEAALADIAAILLPLALGEASSANVEGVITPSANLTQALGADGEKTPTLATSFSVELEV